MKTGAIEKFYNDYKNSISNLSRLEKRLLNESYSYAKWYDTLLLKSCRLREVYSANLEKYADVIEEIVKHPETLTDKDYEDILTHIDFFISEGFRDYGVTVPVLRTIIPYWEQKENPGKLMDCYYFLGVALEDSHYYGEACNAFDKALHCFNDVMAPDEPYWTFRLLCAAYYRLLTYVELERYSENVIVEYYEETLAILTDERIPDWMISPKKKSAIPSILRNLVCYTVFRIINQGGIPSDKLIAIVVEEFYYQNTEASPNLQNCAADIVYYKYLRTIGSCSMKEYEQHILNLVIGKIKTYEKGFTYGIWTFPALFDDELSDYVFSVDKLFFMNPSFAYVNYGLVELLMHTNSDNMRKRICNEIYNYFLELPPGVGDGYVDLVMYPVMTVLLTRCKDEETLVDCILNLLVHRQISTAIHITMVAKLAKCLTSHMVKTHPEYYIGLFGMSTKDEVLANREKLEKFAYTAGIIHDVGKISCTDVITLQNRKILDEEFNRIKVHPVAGSSLLQGSELLSPYASIALCHHLFDDSSKGYPVGVSIPDSAERIFIETITVCDSIDAMSDTLGRNYAKPKNITTIIKELNSEKGTRYSARVLEAFDEATSLIEEISKQLYEERVQVHYDIYRRYVVPNTRFEPEDEKEIVPYCDENKADVIDLLQMTAGEFEKLYIESSDYRFILKDGRNVIHGIGFANRDNAEMYIKMVYVSHGSRRTGAGTEIMEFLEAKAREDGVTKIYIPDAKSGHNDIFIWRNGYSRSSKEDMLEKVLY